MSSIYHIADRQTWAAAAKSGQYEAPSLAEEGFIHCCTKEQVQSVLDRYFPDRTNIILLGIRTELLKSQLVYEWSPSVEDTFPHVYGPINTDAIESVSEF